MVELEIFAGNDDAELSIDGVVAAEMTSDYNKLNNKPTLNGKILEGEVTINAAEVGAVPLVDRLTNEEIEHLIGGV